MIQLITNFLQKLLNNEDIMYENNTDSYTFKLKNIKYKIDMKEIEEYHSNKYKSEDLLLYNNKHFERAVIERSSKNFSRLGLSYLTKSTQLEGDFYSYSLNMSKHYMLFLIKTIMNSSNTNSLINPIIFRRRLERILGLQDSQTSLYPLSLLDLLIQIININVVQIKSKDSTNRSTFEDLYYAYTYNISLCKHITLTSVSLQELIREPLRRMQNQVKEPKRVYNKDLILYYQRAVSANSPDLMYLSFYNILEYFFEKVFNENLRLKLQSIITEPKFDYSDQKSINRLIKLIGKNVFNKKSGKIEVNDLEALKLTLQNNKIDINRLKEELISIDNPDKSNSNMLEYYRDNEVSFSKGVSIDFNNTDGVISNIAKRLINNRNAIVHSKSLTTEDIRYIPFKDETELQKEIYLIKLIAEEIIHNSSNLLPR